MFQTQTEDLIPRSAPKPSTVDLAVTDIHPTVPEVSIVFTRREEPECSNYPQPTSYSEWKNKHMPCLPRAAAAPNDLKPLNSELLSSRSSNFCPPNDSALAILPTPHNDRALASLPTPNVHAIPSGLCKTDFPIKADKQLDHATQTNSQHFIFVDKRFLPSDINQTKNGREHVSTTNAGTQTHTLNNNTDQPCPASKDDVEQIKSMLIEMQKEQRSLLEIVQNLLKFNESLVQNKPITRDVGVQKDSEINKGYLINKPLQNINFSTEEDPKENENPNHHPSNFQTRTSKPILILPKTVTDQSMVMNELAVKYLPNVKLNDMLEEVCIGTKDKHRYNESPLKKIADPDKNPTDLSTASYKYLRKYRLLPGGNNNNNLSLMNDLAELNSENRHEDLLDLENIRYKPKFM